MARAKRDELLSIADAGRRLGMTTAGAAHWASKVGAPVEFRDGKRVALWPAFPVWYRAQLVKERVKPADFEEAKARKMQAEAELAELTLAERRGELATIDMHRAEVRRIVGGVRAQLLAIPGRYAARTAGKVGVAESQRLWTEAMEDVVNNLGSEA